MLFLDSSNPKEVADMFGWGVLSGVTTNPLIISREMPGADLQKTIKAILAVSTGPVSVELTETDEEAMVAEAVRYAEWDKERICIKVPVNAVGLRVIARLHGAGIRTNATCIMDAAQAVLASMAGADYVSLFYGRIKDLGVDADEVIVKTAALLANTRAKIIIGSIRQPADVLEALSSGADIVTVPPKILRQLAHHPRTEETVREFAEAWKASGACRQ